MLRPPRGFREVKGSLYMKTTDGDMDIGKELASLGEEGWGLVSVVPRADYCSVEYQADYAGMTTSELWVLKRPKQVGRAASGRPADHSPAEALEVPRWRPAAVNRLCGWAAHPRKALAAEGL